MRNAALGLPGRPDRAGYNPRHPAEMDTLESHVDPRSELFRANHERMTRLVSELRARQATAREGGGAK